MTKAELLIWLLRAGRDVCMSDVDAAWVALPYAMLEALPEADVTSRGAEPTKLIKPTKPGVGSRITFFAAASLREPRPAATFDET